jgi:hypothetical protein
MDKYQMQQAFILTVAGGVIAFRSAERASGEPQPNPSRRSLVLVAVCSLLGL